MSAIAVNIVIGLITTVLSGGSVWTWQRLKSARILHGKAEFFGLKAGADCLIIMNNQWQGPGATTHNDVHAMIELATLASEIGCPVTIGAIDTQQSNGDRTEFCVGGPDSNARTAGHLIANIPGVTFRPYDRSRADSMEIVVGDEKFSYRQKRESYALVAKFTPAHSDRPVIVISGQRSMGNRAAVHYLKREHRAISKIVASVQQFCIIVRLQSEDIYGHEAVELAADVSAAAFTSHRQLSSTAENG